VIPKKIFQTWKTKNVSDEFLGLMKTWKSKNSNYDYELHDDSECLDFMKKFDKKVCESYLKIIPGAFKADLWRYCVLFEFGGFYCDVDTLCLGSIDDVLSDDVDFMAPVDLNRGNLKHNLFNGFIGSSKGSKIMEECIERIIKNVEKLPKQLDPLDFSACGVLGRSVNKFLGLDETASFVGREGDSGVVRLLRFNPENEIISDYSGISLFQNKNGNPDIQKIYSSSGGSSWTGFDKWVLEKKFL